MVQPADPRTPGRIDWQEAVAAPGKARAKADAEEEEAAEAKRRQAQLDADIRERDEFVQRMLEKEDAKTKKLGGVRASARLDPLRIVCCMFLWQGLGDQRARVRCVSGSPWCHSIHNRSHAHERVHRG